MMESKIDARYCEHCGNELPKDSRNDKRYCNDACRFGAFKNRERISESNLYPPVREKWRQSGLSDLLHMINICMGESFGIKADELERYRNER